jgi:uncharacterized short protein YbdD (DUF466 family)
MGLIHHHGHQEKKPFHAPFKLIKSLDAIRDTYHFLTHDGRYDRYRKHMETAHPDLEPLSFEDFYLEEQNRKWNSGGVMACC